MLVLSTILFRQLTYVLTLSLLLLPAFANINIADQPNKEDAKYHTNCAEASVAILLRLKTCMGIDEAIAKVKGTGLQGDEVSMLAVKNSADLVGISLEGIKSTIDELGAMHIPSIILIKLDGDNGNHFMVLDAYTEGYARVYDNDSLPSIISRKELDSKFTGFALMPKEGLLKDNPSQRVLARTPIIDVGVIWPNSSLTKRFELFTTGEAPVNVIQFEACCGTEVNPTVRWQIKPQKENPVDITWHVPSEGDFIRTATFITDNKEWPIINISVIGSIKPGIKITPSVLDIGIINSPDKTMTITKVVSIHNITPELAKNCSIANTTHFTANIERYDSVSQILSVSISFNPSGIRGVLNDNIIFTLSENDITTLLMLSLRACVERRMELDTPIINWGILGRNEKRKYEVTIIDKIDGEFTVLDVKFPPGIQVTVHPPG